MKIKRISFFERVQGLEEDNFDVKTLSSISINVLTLLSGSHCSLGAEVTTCFSTKKNWKLDPDGSTVRYEMCTVSV